MTWCIFCRPEAPSHGVWDRTSYRSLQPWSHLIAIYLISGGINIFVVMGMVVRVMIVGPTRLFTKKKRTRRPSLLDYPELGEHGYARLSEVTLHYMSRGDDEAPLILFLHGFADFSYSWRHQLKEFGNRYRAVAVDMKGYGDSSKPVSVSDYHITKLSTDIKELVQYMGYEQCVLVGHDWGACVAWHISFMFPEVVDKLVILSLPHPYTFQQHLRTHWRQLIRSWYMFFFQMPMFPEVVAGLEDMKVIDCIMSDPRISDRVVALTPEEVEAYKYTIQNYGDRQGPINYYRAMMRYSPPRGSARVSCPVLLLWGVKDKFIEMTPAEKSQEYCDNFKFVPIDNAGHWVHTDSPKEVNKHIIHFLT